ncbi:hypothetical protein E2C01_085733 [Portunus trituberculatus]|uniref:Uncharacterized protein n=1 Tax=Portunus trituberculatus TaxID=210409 RepID=A0A5B7J7N2_PORTR|nr:hypothetical protein [Portunus trituberculatus]
MGGREGVGRATHMLHLCSDMGAASPEWVVVLGVGVAEVCVQAVLSGERLSTRATHERFVSGVDATVATPFSLVPEQLPAKGAVVHGAPPSPALPPATTATSLQQKTKTRPGSTTATPTTTTTTDATAVYSWVL